MKEAGQRERESDRIVRLFTDRLFTGALVPGDQLPSEAALCEQYSASRTVVREAIQQLKARGIVDTINGKGSFIAESRMEHFQDSLHLFSSRSGNVQDWMDLLALRSLIETECTRELAESEDVDAVKGVKRALDVMQQARGDLALFAEADIEFHHTIVSASSNRLYIAVWRSLREMCLRFALDTYRSMGQVDANLRDHKAIYSAIKDRRTDEAVRAIKNHLRNSRQNLSEISTEGST